MDIRFNCINPACGRRMAVNEAMAGQSTACPACGTRVTVPASSQLKLTCAQPDCGQHMVVDVAEAGRFLRCPACGKLMQIPGAAAKSGMTAPSLTASPRQPPPASRGAVGEADWPQMSGPPLRRLARGWGVAAMVFLLLICGFYVHSRLVMPGQFDRVAEEIVSVGDFRGAPVANHQGTALVYPRDVKDGGAIFLMDLITKSNLALVKQAEGGGMDFYNMNLFGWSPDDRYLVLPERTNNAGSSHGLIIYDVKSASIRQTVELPKAVREVVWMTTNSLVAVIRPGRFYLIQLAGDQAAARREEVVELSGQTVDADGRRYWLTPMSDHEVAYIDHGNVWSLDTRTGQNRQLSELDRVTLEWLDYDHGSGDFLFNLSDNKKRREWLYRFNPNIPTNHGLARVVVNDVSKNGEPTPVARELKGQWILGGAGVAFVKESLFVQANEAAYATNLFRDGYVQSYTVSPQQNKLFAVAGFDPDPMGLWEYDIGRHELSQVLAGLDKHFTSSQVVPIESGRLAADDGKTRITYLFLPPAQLNEHKKYPALVCIPHGTHWTPESQLIANAGIYCAFAPPRSELTNAGNLTLVARQMLTANLAMRKNPNVDPQRIYVLGESHQTADVCSLLAHDPSLWRGAIFAPPTALPELPAVTKHFPSLLISIGTGDTERSQSEVEAFTRKAWQANVRLRVVYHKNGSHILASTDLIKERYEAVVKFILQDY